MYDFKENNKATLFYTQEDFFMAIRYYVRISTLDQKLDRQLVAYDKADVTYADKMTGASMDRPQLQLMLSDLAEGDVVVVRSLDRLSRSTKDLLEIVDTIQNKKASLKILDINLDTNDKFGEFFLTVLAAISQLERKTIKERQREGIAIAKSKGIYKGRKKGAISLSGDDLAKFKRYYNLGMTKADLAREFHVQRCTIYSWIKELKRRNVL